MMNIITALENCRHRAIRYLNSVVYRDDSKYYWRHSPAHDPHGYRGHLLYGTWSGAMASVLLGLDKSFTAEEKQGMADAINSFQQPDGIFVINGISVSVDDYEYFAFHCTNYALGALRALGIRPRYKLSFAEPLRTRRDVMSWLEKRDWDRPWTEGNNVVNLASFYAILAEEGESWACERLMDMAGWHDTHQNHRTGFWHAHECKSRRHLIHAMAGAVHNLHIYYYLNRDVPHPDLIIDSCLKLGYMGIRSACKDIDMVDILVHMRRYDYKVREIDTVLRAYLIELLQIQNVDGGFANNYVTPDTIYGLSTPARVSVTWTTWFRLATIGMISSALFPHERGQWSFRNTLGMGYCNLSFALDNLFLTSQPSVSAQVSNLTELSLSARRNARFIPDRVKYHVHQWLLRKKK